MFWLRNKKKVFQYTNLSGGLYMYMFFNHYYPFLTGGRQERREPLTDNTEKYIRDIGLAHLYDRPPDGSA